MHFHYKKEVIVWKKTKFKAIRQDQNNENTAYCTITIVFLIFTVHNASTYVEKKYNKDFKIISINLPYYKDDSDSFDCPLLYISGEFDSIRLVSDDSYHFDTEIKDGKTTVKVGKTEVFHIFEFDNKQ